MDAAPLFLDPFGPDSIIPEIRRYYLFFKFSQLFFLFIYLKDAPLRQVYGPLIPGFSV